MAGAGFDDRDLIDQLDRMDAQQLDQLPFGVIAFDAGGIVTAYNADESARSGLDPDRVLGRHLFRHIGPCMNNTLIAGRFAGYEFVDSQLDYVFTFRLVRTPVRLRLLARPESPRRYVVLRSR